MLPPQALFVVFYRIMRGVDTKIMCAIINLIKLNGKGDLSEE